MLASSASSSPYPLLSFRRAPDAHGPPRAGRTSRRPDGGLWRPDAAPRAMNDYLAGIDVPKLGYEVVESVGTDKAMHVVLARTTGATGSVATREA